MTARKFIGAGAVMLLPMLCIGIATAATGVATISFTAPTTYANGAPLAAADIAGYNIDCTFEKPDTTVAPCALNPITIPPASPGTVSITVPDVGGKACFQLRTVLKNNATSDMSAPPACKTFAATPPANPSAPKNVTVVVTVTVAGP
jgi:hypothetical protein